MAADPIPPNHRDNAIATDGAVIVFDGQCALCNGSIRFVLRHDRHARYRFAASQGHTGRRLLLSHGQDPDDPASFLLLDGGHAWTDSDAVIRVLVGLGGYWRTCTVLRYLPRSLRDSAYRLLARHRMRWFGMDACLVPTPAQRDRFID